MRRIEVLSLEEVRERLSGARTRREFDAVVRAFRTEGVVTAEDRPNCEALSEELVQRFASPEQRSKGTRLRPGKTRSSFQTVSRSLR